MKALFKRCIRQLGYEFKRLHPVPNHDFPKHFGEEERQILSTVKPYTLTSPERICALVDAIHYLEKYEVPGDVAECGVWRGGSMMAIALALLNIGRKDRKLFLYDTFEGMTLPTEHDKSFDGRSALEQLNAQPRGTGIWCEADERDVRANLTSTGYPTDQVKLIPGRVEETILKYRPEKLALLRLDTDWYESTKIELEYLYPLLAVGGILIIDDYGHWQGAKRAVDEYFDKHGIKAFLHRIDYTARLVVKQ